MFVAIANRPGVIGITIGLAAKMLAIFVPNILV